MGGYDDLLGDGRLLKRVVATGAGDAPRPGGTVAVRYETRVVREAGDAIGKVGELGEVGELIDSSGDVLFDFTLGSEDVLEAWNLAIPTMKPNERSVFLAHPSLTYGEDGAGDDIPPGALLEFTIHLFPAKVETTAPNVDETVGKSLGAGKLQKSKESVQMQRLRRATEAKERGNQLTRNGEFHAARKAYKEALMLLKPIESDCEVDVTQQMFEEMHQLRLSCFLNLSQCDLKVEEYPKAIDSATSALELDSGNCKALYRRGVAQLRQGAVEEAKVDLLKAFQADPNAEIRARLEECREKLAASAQWHKNAFGGIFHKAPEQLARDRDLSVLPQVWLEIQIGNGPIYRLNIALYSDTVPRTAENFRCLCTGERAGTKGLPLSFRRSVVHKVIPRSLVEGGDITKFNGTGGESIYGPTFSDEGFQDLHHKRGLLSMVNRGPNSNSSKFMVTLRSLPEFDGKNVVFGEVLSGLDALDAMEAVDTEYPDWPKTQIMVVACGDRRS